MAGFVVCTGFLPVGSCAKAGCQAGSRAATRAATRSATRSVARSVTQQGSYAISRSATRTIPPGRFAPLTYPGLPARTVLVPVPVPVAGAGHLGAESAHAASLLDDAVRAMPEVQGTVSAIATSASPRGAALATSSSTRTFGRDYGRAVSKVGVSERQHKQILDAFDVAQAILEEAAERALTGDDDDDDDDDKAASAHSSSQPRALAPSPMDLLRAERLLDKRLRRTLDPTQRAQLEALLGSPMVMVQRLAIERPVVRADTRPGVRPVVQPAARPDATTPTAAR